MNSCNEILAYNKDCDHLRVSFEVADVGNPSEAKLSVRCQDCGESASRVMPRTALPV